MKSKSKSEYVKGFGRVTFAWGIVPTGVAVQNVPGQREWKAFKKLANGKAKRRVCGTVITIPRNAVVKPVGMRAVAHLQAAVASKKSRGAK